VNAINVGDLVTKGFAFGLVVSDAKPRTHVCDRALVEAQERVVVLWRNGNEGRICNKNDLVLIARGS
jgi:hypothetical protein